MTDSPARHPAAEVTERLEARARELGFSLFGVAKADPTDHMAFYRSWLARSLHGEMAYLARDSSIARRADLRATMDAVRSVVVVAHEYDAEDDAARTADAARGVIARYARGADYHGVVKRKLVALSRWLDGEVEGGVSSRAYVDTGPILERDLARRAGLGWFGRNTMLIHPRRGSYFFIGLLLVDVHLVPSRPFEHDRCGSCRACLDACPTGALLGRNEDGAPVIDARRCISYLTIELRGPIPIALRPHIGNRIFGCDICQEVCPYNGPKFVQLTRERDFTPRDHVVGRGLIDLMRMDEAAWDELSRGSAIRRAGYVGFKRNVAVALGNWGAPEAVPVLASAIADPAPLVRGHAAWALGEIGSRAATSRKVTLAIAQALSDGLRGERAPDARDEMAQALRSIAGAS